MRSRIFSSRSLIRRMKSSDIALYCRDISAARSVCNAVVTVTYRPSQSYSSRSLHGSPRFDLLASSAPSGPSSPAQYEGLYITSAMRVTYSAHVLELLFCVLPSSASPRESAQQSLDMNIMQCIYLIWMPCLSSSSWELTTL